MNNKISRLIVWVFPVLLSLSGCSSTMNLEDCAALDWETIGYNDGQHGIVSSSEKVTNYQRACADTGVTPDMSAYERGRKDGLREYCEPSNGFEVGRAGSAYRNQCDANLESSFLEKYELGKELFSYENPVKQLSRELEDKSDYLKKVEYRNSLNVKRAGKDETSEEQKRYLMSLIRQSESEMENIRKQIDQLQLQLESAEVRLLRFKNRKGY